MKKNSIISLVLVMVMAFALCVPAFASSQQITGSGNSASTNVTYSPTEGFLIEIPSEVAIDTDTLKGTLTVTASKVILTAPHTLTVKVASNAYSGGWKLTSAGGTLDYTITGEGAIENNGTVLTVANGTSTGSQQLNLEITSQNIKQGSYSDSLTFTATIA